MRTRTPLIFVLASLLAASGCGGSATPAGAPATDDGSPPGSECDGRAFASTFAALEEVVFARNGCTQAICHGEAVSGGLDLRSESAYRNLIGAASSGSELPTRISASGPLCTIAPTVSLLGARM